MPTWKVAALGVQVAGGSPLAARPRALALAPIVDRSGYTLIGPKRAGAAAADVRRLDELGMGAGAWSHVAGCL